MNENDDVNLLIIEPNGNLAQTMQEDFEVQGFLVTVANNLSVAENIINNINFIAIIIQSTLSNATETFNFINKLKNTELQPVIVLTTSDADFPIDIAFATGVDAVFVKPFDRITLEELIKAAVVPRFKNLYMRKVTRIDAIIPITIFSDNSNFVYNAKTENVSQGGLFVVTKNLHLPHVNDIITFKLEYPENIFIEGKAQITWIKMINISTQRFGFGIKFIQEHCNLTQIHKLINDLKTLRTYSG